MNRILNHPLMQIAVDLVRPPPRLTVGDWCSKNVRLVGGLSPKLDLSISPHQLEALDATGDGSIKEIIWLFPPGSGKTTMIEGFVQHKLCCAPCNIMIVGQTEELSDVFFDTRLRPSMEMNQEMRAIMPDDRHKIRKGMVIFKHGCYINLVGPSKAGLQEKSCPVVVIDEAWSMSNTLPGRMTEALSRQHGKWNAKALFVGQAGDSVIPTKEGGEADSDLYKKWMASSRREFHFECRKCKCPQQYYWHQLKYDKAYNEDGTIDWNLTEPTIRYECINKECDETYKDTPADRRSMASSLVGREQYRVTNPNYRKGVEAYHHNVLGIWRLPWMAAVVKWEDANESARRGDKSNLKAFVNKEFAEFWKDSTHEEKIPLTSGQYRISDFEDGNKFEGELGRCLSVDVQQISVWYSVWVFTELGMHLLACGQLLGADEIETIREKYGVNRKATMLDAGYRPSYVIQVCAAKGYTAVRGVERDEFTVTMASGERVRTPYSAYEQVLTGAGKRAGYIQFCINTIKDTVQEMRKGECGEIITPVDVPTYFLKHLDAEARRMVPYGKSKKLKMVWVKIKKDNHLLDTLVYAVGYGAIKGFLKVKLPEAPSPDE